MPVSFDEIKVGAEYDRLQLAELWGYKGFQALGKGAFTPAGSPYVVFFITGNRRGVDQPYENSLEDGILRIEGERGHGSDRRIINAERNGDQIHLFFREKDHRPFVYQGEVFLTEYSEYTDQPSRFAFAVGRDWAAAVSAIAAEERTHGTSAENPFIPDEEGRRIPRQHIVYERSRKNRARALEIHGTACKVCGFDFNVFYGKELAADFIEVHHVDLVAKADGRSINPEADLLPVCSNCHSMLHRKKGQVLAVKELREIIKRSDENRNNK